MNAPANIYSCKVMHQRFFPMHYKFNYKVFSFLVDIDQLDKITKNPLVSLNRFNLFSLNTKDHGARDGTPWRQWLDDLLSKNNIKITRGRTRLLCFPRILGYTFNPISLWFCEDEDHDLIAVICEVSNTFGENHHYLIHNQNKALKLPVKAKKDKHFHVSPFINMRQQYQFSIDQPEEKLRILINEYENDELMLVAMQTGNRKNFTTTNLLLYFFMMPLMTMKIMFLIHWQALKIWIKGGKYHSKPEPPIERTS
jgi:DUF1365 family protein